jgi:hypothetical protein
MKEQSMEKEEGTFGKVMLGRCQTKKEEKLLSCETKRLQINQSIN